MKIIFALLLNITNSTRKNGDRYINNYMQRYINVIIQCIPYQNKQNETLKDITK